MIEIPLGNPVIELEVVDSTNLYASTMMQNSKLQEGTVIMAQFQSAGRGQRGAGWESEKGKNLTVSYVLYPTSLMSTEHFTLNQVLSLGVRDFVQLHSVDKVCVKWPNDIMIGNRKVAGLLIENSIRGNKIQHCIAGIGININQLSFNKYDPEAVSLAMISHRSLDLRDCLSQLSNSMSKWYTLLAVGNKRMIKESYSDALFRKGELSWFQTGDHKFRGTIQSIMPQGELVIVQEDGFEYVFKYKEVKYLY